MRRSSQMLIAALAGGWLVSLGALPQAARAEDRMLRSGQPYCIAPWANYGVHARYCGYYVGGGARPHKGEGRYPHEGTWGVDYLPWRHSRIALNWWHGRKHQDGGGQYEPDARVDPFQSLRRDVDAAP